MKDVIIKELIFLDKNFNSQEEVFKFFAEELINQDRGNKKEDIVKGFYQREAEFSTAMSDGIAIPHCRNIEIYDASVLVVRNHKKIKWTEDEDVDLMFALMIPEINENQIHIKVLAHVAQLIMEESFVSLVKKTKSIEEIYDVMGTLNTLFK